MGATTTSREVTIILLERPAGGFGVRAAPEVGAAMAPAAPADGERDGGGDDLSSDFWSGVKMDENIFRR